jgi:hypothetical protein
MVKAISVVARWRVVVVAIEMVQAISLDITLTFSDSFRVFLCFSDG